MTDAISQLHYTIVKHDKPWSVMFAKHSKDDEILYPLTVKEIAASQKADRALQENKDICKNILVENTNILYKDGKLVIPKSLQHGAVSWYHHYLQHPGSTHLEGTKSCNVLD